MQQGADEDSSDATSATTSHLRIIVAQQAADGHFLSSLPQAGRSCQEGTSEEPEKWPLKPWT